MDLRAHPEPKSIAEAHERGLIGKRVLKSFPVDGSFEDFEGKISKVEQLHDETGQLSIQYLVKYEDGDREHLDWEEVVKHTESWLEKRGKQPRQPIKQEHMAPDSVIPRQTSDVGRGRKRAAEVPAEDAAYDGHDSPEDDSPNPPAKRRANAAGPAGRRAANAQWGHAAGPAQGVKAGHLKKVRVENFMCHECFEVELGPNVTLITGANGSGKSAVMQALQTCLGVTARTTGRATNLTSFIKNGQHEARVQVTLWNPQGDDAFKYETYGPSITIERRIPRGQGASYKVLDASGRTMSTQKSEVDAILDNFNINAANPLTVVTQDMARQFFSNGAQDQRKKFDMYMQGTLLEDLAASIRQAKQMLDQTEGELAEARGELRKRQADLKQLEEKRDSLVDVDKKQELADQLRKAAAWQRVHVLRGEVERLQDMVDGYAELAEDNEQAVAEIQEKLTAHRESVQAKVEQIESGKGDMEELAKELELLKERLKEERRKGQLLRRDIQETQSEINKLQDEKAEYQRELEAAADPEVAAEAKRKLEEYQQLVSSRQQAVQAADATYDEARKRYQELNSSKDAVAQRARQVEGEGQAIRRAIDSLQQQRAGLQQAAHNRLMLFGGRQVQNLLAEIAKHRESFQYEVIGPIGLYLGLTDSKWSTAMEASIGRMFNNFICFSSADAQRLRTLARSLNMNTSVVTTKWGAPQHTIQNRPLPGFITALDVLKCTDPAKTAPIMNVLVDMGKVEMLVLVDTTTQGNNVVHDNAAGGRFDAMDVKGSKYEGGATRFIRPYDRRGAPRLGMDATQQQQQLEDLIAEEEGKVAGWQERMNQARADMQQLLSELERANAEQIRAAKAKSEARSALAKVENDRPQLQSGGADKADYVSQHIMATQSNIAQTQVSLGELKGRLQQAQHMEEEIRRQFEEKKQLLDGRNESYGPIAEEIGVLQQEIEALDAALGQHQEKARTEAAEYAAFVAQLADKRSELEQYTKWAAKVCSEQAAGPATAEAREHMRLRLAKRQRQAQGVVGGAGPSTQQQQAAAPGGVVVREEELERAMACEVLQKEVENVEKQIRAKEADAGGNRQQLEEVCEQMSREVHKQRALVNGMVSSHHKLKASYNKRLETYQRLQDHVQATISLVFSRCMGRRHHVGRIKVDYDNADLKLVVKMKGKTDAKAEFVEDLKQLSGGERSYTMVSFLLAVGSYTESPFRCLDEFDVYMDAITRRFATELLLEFAWNNKENQYILLTPQDIQAFDDAKRHLEAMKREAIPDDFIKIAMMRPPRSNATAVQGI